LKIAKWYNNYQAPAVLMIDDLNDVYLEVYKESFKNDWGYLCSNEGSAYSFLKKELLNKFSKIKITFFTPYAKHNVINPNGAKHKRYGVGEREEFSSFLQYLQNLGHEIAHHGSNHGKYKDINNPSTQNGNFIHEWELFESVQEGVEITLKGVEVFKNIGIRVSGGKFCGYKSKENSLEIIDKCNFLYWCADSGVNEIKRFGKNRVIKFPTTFAGNSFVRLSYKTGNFKKDFIKLFTKFLQPIYNKKEYKKLNLLYANGDIIAIQEHISPATSSALVQSANIISDIKSLNKIFKFLETKDIWYATCHEISSYIELKDNISLEFNNSELILNLSANSKVKSGTISLVLGKNLKFKDSNGKAIKSFKRKKDYTVNLPVNMGVNRFEVIK